MGASRFEEMGKTPKQTTVFVEINPKILLYTSARHSGEDVVVHAGQEKMPPAACGSVVQGHTWLVCTVWLLRSLQ